MNHQWGIRTPRGMDWRSMEPSDPPQFDEEFDDVALENEPSTIAQRLDELMRRMREEHYSASYVDLLNVRGRS